MDVSILTPSGEIFKGQADVVQLPGVDGLFELLNNHAPMIAALGPGKLKLVQSGKEQFFRVEAGFVEVLRNQVSILVEGAEQA
jgi:F-type H+-transporting ATPase subunit epsilon